MTPWHLAVLNPVGKASIPILWEELRIRMGISQSLLVLIEDSTALCTQFHCKAYGSYSYLYWIAIKSTSFGLWPRLKYQDLGSKTTLPFRRCSEYILLPLRWFTKPFHRLVTEINHSLQIQAIWDKEWQSCICMNRTMESYGKVTCLLYSCFFGHKWGK